MAQTSTSWRPGRSGNPRGRPRGSGRTAPLTALLDSNAEPLLQAVLTQALSGDITAARLLFDRYGPSLRPESYLEPGWCAEGGVASSQALLARVADGSMPVETALAAQQLVLNHAKVVESEELAARIGALEARMTP